MKSQGRKQTKTRASGHQDGRIRHSAAKDIKAEERRKAAEEFFKSFDDIEPCRHCGRVMLAGWCCRKMLDDLAKQSDTGQKNRNTKTKPQPKMKAKRK